MERQHLVMQVLCSSALLVVLLLLLVEMSCWGTRTEQLEGKIGEGGQEDGAGKKSVAGLLFNALITRTT